MTFMMVSILVVSLKLRRISACLIYSLLLFDFTVTLDAIAAFLVASSGAFIAHWLKLRIHACRQTAHSLDDVQLVHARGSW